MAGDWLIIASGAARLCLDSSEIIGIVETDRISFMPGQSGFVSGVIMLRGSAVAVVDLARAFDGMEPAAMKDTQTRIIVAGDKTRSIGLAIGSSEISFLWGQTATGATITDEKGVFSSGRLNTGSSSIKIIDWRGLFEETARILSTEGGGVQKSSDSR